jgi:hypothetical protein
MTRWRLWPISEVAARLIDVRSRGRSGLDLLTLSSSGFDPLPAFARTKSRSAATSRGLISPMC